MDGTEDKNVWPNKPLTDLLAWVCLITRIIGFIFAGYGLYLVKLQINKGNLAEALEVTCAAFLVLINFHYIIHSAFCQLQKIVARKVYGYDGDDQKDERVGLMIRATIYATIIFAAAYHLLKPF